MNANNRYYDLDNQTAVTSEQRAIAQRKVSGLSIAALIIGILCIPAIMAPAWGIIVSGIGIIVGIIALVRASRQGGQRAYAICGLVLAIIGMVVSVLFTASLVKAAQDCLELRDDAFVSCVQGNLS